jgi:hypothetical protein
MLGVIPSAAAIVEDAKPKVEGRKRKTIKDEGSNKKRKAVVIDLSSDVDEPIMLPRLDEPIMLPDMDEPIELPSLDEPIILPRIRREAEVIDLT